MDSCWNRIGVRGDGSCPELEQYVHCRNCPVHAAAAVALLETAPPADYLETWTRHFSQPVAASARDLLSVVIFRVDDEWLALPTAVVEEIARPLPVHSLPHQRHDAVLGVTNIRGSLTVCMSLGRILHAKTAASPPSTVAGSGHLRFLVLRRDTVRVVCPVADVHGTHRFDPADEQEVPATLAKAAARHARALLSWNGRSVGILDEPSLFSTLEACLA